MTEPRFEIDGDVALVTGGSSGIGEAIAERFAAAGVDVVVCSREQDHVDPVAESIEETTASEALAVECDVTDRDAVEAMIDATVAEFGGLDVLVNNAGGSFVANFEDVSPNGWRTIVDVNLTGTYHCTQAAADALKDGGGSVVNLSSVAGREGAPTMTPYAAAKAGVEALTRSLAQEWAPAGVRVNAIAAGFVATPGIAQQLGIDPGAIDREVVDRRIATSEEIAAIAHFLASRGASFVTGETLTARGAPEPISFPEAQS